MCVVCAETLLLTVINPSSATRCYLVSLLHPATDKDYQPLAMVIMIMMGDHGGSDLVGDGDDDGNDNDDDK